MKALLSLLGIVMMTATAYGQSDSSSKKNVSVSIGKEGVKISRAEREDVEEDKRFEVHYGMLDLGINYLQDKTNYSDPAVQQFLNVSPELRNENLFSLRDAKSINVNIYPVVASYRLINGKSHRAYLSAGLGLQLYNFRFNKSTTYVNETVPEVVMDSISFKKNKLAFTFLSVPLMLTFKTRLAEDAWLVYGVGITGGYRVSSWMKQVSSERGKQKNHDPFNFKNFNSCVTAEIGVDGYFRLYASYQLTPLHEDIMTQHPYAIGVRFLGI